MVLAEEKRESGMRSMVKGTAPGPPRGLGAGMSWWMMAALGGGCMRWGASGGRRSHGCGEVGRPARVVVVDVGERIRWLNGREG